MSKALDLDDYVCICCETIDDEERWNDHGCPDCNCHEIEERLWEDAPPILLLTARNE